MRFTGKRQEWREVADPNTKAAAGERMREMLRELESPAEIAAETEAAALANMTFAQAAKRFADDHVHEAVYENGVKVSGMRDHAGVRAVIEKILIPALGTRRVASLTFPDLEQLQNNRREAPKLRGGRTVVETSGRRSIARVNREMSVLRAILNHAVELGAIPRSPMTRRGKAGKPLIRPQAERARTRTLSVQEESRMLAAYSKPAFNRTRDYFIVALDTGMRRAELLGITVADVDLKTKSINLPWAITKSKRARVIPMSHRVLAIMRSRLASRVGADRIFDDLSATVIRNDFRAVKAAAKVEDFRMHDCRATVATRLLQAGISEAEISMLTGHRLQQQAGGGAASSPVLRKHYLRLTPKTLTRAADAMNGRKPN